MIRLATWLAVSSIGFSMLSCGRPPGNAPAATGSQQPGIAAAPMSQAQLQEQAKLQTKLQQLGTQEQEVSSQLDDLRGRLADAQVNLSTLQAQMQSELAQKTDQYATQDLQYRTEEQNRADAEAQLNAQIQDQQRSLGALDGTIRQQRAWGFDSPDLDSSLVAEQQMKQQLASLQAQYRALQQQAGQAAALQGARSRWEEGTDQSSFEQQYQSKVEQAQKTVQDLSAQYQKLRGEDDQLWQSMGDTQDQLEVSTSSSSLNAG